MTDKIPRTIWAGTDKETGIFAYCHSEVAPCHEQYTHNETMVAELLAMKKQPELKDAPQEDVFAHNAAIDAVIKKVVGER